jgi:hypothetical protein
MLVDDCFLSLEDVRHRLMLCSSETIDDMYAFGQRLADETLERVRNIERKATLFAAYGTGVVTLLASSFSTWAAPGNRHTVWLAICASSCAALCTYFAINVLRLRQGSFTSEDEWLKEECLDDMMLLKRYRIQTLWGTIDWRMKQHSEQTAELYCAELALKFSGFFLVWMLVQLSFQQFLRHTIASRQPVWQWQFLAHWSLIGDVFVFALILGMLWRFFLGLSMIRPLRMLFHSAVNYKSYETTK